MIPPGEAPPAGPPTVGRRLGLQLGLLVPGLDELRAHEPVLAPLVLMSAFSLTTGFAIQPFVDAAAAGEPGRALGIFFWIIAVLAPLLAGVKALILAVLAWSGLVVLGRDLRLRPLVSVFLYGEAILALHGVAITVGLTLRGVEAISSVEDLYIPMGLDALVSLEEPVLQAVTQGTTPFHLAWAVFVAVALVKVVGLSRRAALVAAVGAWALVLSLDAVRAVALG